MNEHDEAIIDHQMMDEQLQLLPPADEIVARYIELRDYVKARTDELEKTGATSADQELIARCRGAADSHRGAGAFLTNADCRDIADRLEQLLTPLCRYKEAMQALEGAADLLMKQTGQKALSTDHGTAYYSHTLSAKCEDPQAFFDFVFQHNAREYLTSHVAKEAVEAYMDGPGAGHPPPGVKTEQVVKVNFRKS